MRIVKLVIIALLLSTDAFSFNRSALENMVSKAEIDFNLPEGLLDAIVKQESNYKIFAKNPKSKKNKVKISSYGLGQLTIPSANHHCGLSRKQIYHPRKNIRCSAKILNHQLRRFQGKIERAIAAYQWGTPCECNGKVYTRQMNRGIQVCKLNKRPMRCKKKGTFFNQYYVDGVMKKRTMPL